MGMGEFNSDDQYTYYCGQESLRRNGVVLIVKKESEMQYLDTISKTTEWSLFISKANHSYHCNPSLCPDQYCWRSWCWSVLWRLTRPFRTNSQKDALFIIGDWNAKVGSQETPGVTGKLDLGVQNEAGQRLIEFCQENALVIAKTLFQQQNRRLNTWNHQMVDTEIRLLIFFTAKDGEARYSQQKQDWELIVAQIMNSLLPNSDWNWRKWRKPLDHSGMM